MLVFQMHLILFQSTQQEFKLQISGLTEGCHNDVIIDIPITIGTYPILDQANANVPSVSQSPNPNPRIYKPAVVSQQPTRSNGTNVEDIELKPSAPYPDEGILFI